ncbi:MAG TPA: hypothetical protein VLE70_02130 [Anaerolineae bacterium]|nr:hypothetical protein [Anaerolineae bacterium]
MIVKDYRITTWLVMGAMISALLLSACSLLESSRASARTPEEAISAAVLDYLTEQRAETEQFETEVEQIEGDFARVKIISTDPAVPGGFTGFLARQDGVWTTLIVGSGFNPMELQALGIPESILPESWAFPDEPPADPEESAACPLPVDGTKLLTDEAHGYCLLYPTSHTVVQLESGNTEIVVGDLMNHIDPRVSIKVEPAKGRSAAQAADEWLADFSLPDFDIKQSATTIGGQEAVMLDMMPGQDLNRQLLVVHDGQLYHLFFAPFDPSAGESYAQMEELFGIVTGSFVFR